MEKKYCEMSPGENESSGYFDDQEGLRASPNCQSPTDNSHNHALQSPEISYNNDENEDHETVKSLSEKLSAALLSIGAKEDLVKQHSKVAEEAVSGWEKAEAEVAVVKQQLDVAAQKNSALEDRISHLDGALKECVRQLRQSKEEHEQKVRDAIIRNTQECESNKSELENQLIDLKIQLEASKGEVDKLGTIEKENAALKLKLLALSEELEIQRMESELSTKTAETASKQHLESIKKVAKLEAECRKLRATAQKATSSSACVESLTDSQSDNCSDSWASALIAELDQFKNEKTGAKVAAGSVDIDSMDDFLEMERLAAMPGVDHGSCSTSKVEEDGDEKVKMAKLEGKVEVLENEKAKLCMGLADCQNQLTVAEGKLIELESRLELALLEAKKLRDSVASLEEGKVEESAYSSELKARLEASEAKRVGLEKLREKVILLETEVEEERTLSAELASKLEATEGEKKALELELELAESKFRRLNDDISLLEQRFDMERALSEQFAERCQNLEDELSRKKREAELRVASCSNGELTAKQEKELAVAAEKLVECQRTIASLGQQLKSLTKLDDIMFESEKLDLNGRGRGSPPYSPTSSTSVISGFGRLLSRSRSSSRIENQ